jgi:hypothetical protein
MCGAIAACLTSPSKTMFVLPAAAGSLGLCYGFLAGGIFAVLISYYYLVLPYAIDLNVAVSLGGAFGLMLVYAATGRQHKRFEPPHASEYAD